MDGAEGSAMLGTPFDSRASYGQVHGLPMAAAADLCDQVEAECMEADEVCHARHAAMCPASCDAPGSCATPCRSGEAQPVAVRPGAAVPLDEIVACCVDYERRVDPTCDEQRARDDLVAFGPQLRRWYERSAGYCQPAPAGRDGADARRGERPVARPGAV